jgi:hypothetical protein
MLTARDRAVELEQDALPRGRPSCWRSGARTRRRRASSISPSARSWATTWPRSAQSGTSSSTWSARAGPLVPPSPDHRLCCNGPQGAGALSCRAGRAGCGLIPGGSRSAIDQSL